MILLVDNYDSFTYNLAQYLGTFTEVEVLQMMTSACMSKLRWQIPSSSHPVQDGLQMLGKWK